MEGSVLSFLSSFIDGFGTLGFGAVRDAKSCQKTEQT
jgi:hypothetical protein